MAFSVLGSNAANKLTTRHNPTRQNSTAMIMFNSVVRFNKTVKEYMTTNSNKSKVIPITDRGSP
jgi:hypothetical protein